MMTMRKRLRRRNAVRELLQKLVIPFCEDAQRASGGMSCVPRPVPVNASRAGEERRARGYSHDWMEL